jgi:DNA-binding response OmpR family regulator
VLVSGFPKDHDIQTLLENAHTRYVRKPYDRDDLTEALGAVLGDQRSRQRTRPAPEVDDATAEVVSCDFTAAVPARTGPPAADR